MRGATVGESAYVRAETIDRIGVLTIDHPPVNALDAATFRELEAAFDRALADPGVKVIVITGTGRSFVAGADIHVLASMQTPADAEEMARGGQALMSRIERAPKPVIAAINGRYCLGGGNELAMACHIRIAEERTKFGQPEITLGLIPGWGGSRRLADLVGLGRALELILTGDPIHASEAHRIGLVNRVVPEGGALEEALRLGGRLAALSGEALRRALDCVVAGRGMSHDDAMAYEAARFGEMVGTEDMREGVNAFLEKRRAQFRDR
ncbi:MAG: enoyl-CoA hydratase/isomerase family protein [Anaerolineae bacterium]|nr:enoyl-CoA hydratase/isomerase family protein [Anaerolineae bacterium]